MLTNHDGYIEVIYSNEKAINYIGDITIQPVNFVHTPPFLVFDIN